MARKVGPAGKVFSTELDPDRRRAIRDRVSAAGLQNVTVLEAAAGATNLPDACCDVVFLRNVYHHIQQPERFAASIARAVKPEGAIVVIDFEPGALWLHGGRPDDRGPPAGARRFPARRDRGIPYRGVRTAPGGPELEWTHVADRASPGPIKPSRPTVER